MIAAPPLVTPRQLRHAREKSLHVQYTHTDVARLAKEVIAQTIADVELSLFGFWIREDKLHFEQAKLHIRELSLDQGYAVSRIPNPYLRTLLEDVRIMRPRAPLFTRSRVHNIFKSRIASAPSLISDAASTTTGSAQDSVMSPVTSPWSASSTLRGFRQSPPNTPDRPAPLLIKSRGSNNCPLAPTPKTAVSRSASSPVRIQKPLRTSSLSPLAINDANASLGSFSFTEERHDDWESLHGSNEEAGSTTMSPPAAKKPTARSPFAFEDEDEESPLRYFAGISNMSNARRAQDQEAEPEVSSSYESGIKTSSGSVIDEEPRPVSESLSDLFECVTDLANSLSPPTSPATVAPAINSSSATTEHLGVPGEGPVPFSLKPLPKPTPGQRRRAAAEARELSGSKTPSRGGSNVTRLPRMLTLREDVDSAECENYSTTGPLGLDPLATLKRHATISSPPRPSNPFSASGSSRRRYDIPSSNGTSSSRLDRPLPLRSYGISPPLPQFHRHLVRAATQPSPSRRGNGMTTGGVEEMTLRVGPKALKSRPSVSAASSRLHLNLDVRRIRSKRGVPSPALTPLPQGGMGAGHRTDSNSTENQFLNPSVAFPQDPLISASRMVLALSGLTPDMDTSAFHNAYKAVTVNYMMFLLSQTRGRGSLLPSVHDEPHAVIDPAEAEWLTKHADLVMAIYGKPGVLLDAEEKKFVEAIGEELEHGVGQCAGWESVKEIFGLVYY